MALAGLADKSTRRVFVILSDGECDEGSVWEAALFAGHRRLHNLVAMVDYNRLQSFGRVADVLDLEPFADKWRSFGWHVDSIDGHDVQQINEACQAAPRHAHKPTVLLANTIKGKGVSFMEDRLAWHYKSPDAQQLADALAELGEKP
jgi:transketolase